MRKIILLQSHVDGDPHWLCDNLQRRFPLTKREQWYPGMSHPSAVQGRQETRVRPLGRDGLLEEEMATHSSILAWKIPRTGEPGGLQSRGSKSQTPLTVHEPTLSYVSLQPLEDLLLPFLYHVVPPRPAASGSYSPQPIETAWQRQNHQIL